MQFEENAAKIGIANPFDEAAEMQYQNLEGRLQKLSLDTT